MKDELYRKGMKTRRQILGPGREREIANTEDDLKRNNGKPNAAYMKHFIDGAKHHRLPQHYFDKLLTIETVG